MGDESFILQRFRAECISPLNIDYVTVVSDGTLSVCDLSSQTFDLSRRTDLQSFSGEEAIDAPVAPILATGSSADFVGVGGTSDSIFVHDLSKLGDGPLLLEACPTVNTAGEHGANQIIDASYANESQKRWIVRHLHIEGSVLLVLAEPNYVFLEGLAAADMVSSSDSLSLTAWHLPTCRILVSNRVLRGNITAFSRSNSIRADRTAFAVSQPVGREGRVVHYVILPGSSATKVRTGRSTGLTGPQRKLISGSDKRARRSIGMRKR